MARELGDVFGGAGWSAPSDAVFRGGGGDGGLGRDHLRVFPVERATEAQREIAWADEEAVDTRRAGDGVDIGERLLRLDLDDEESVGVGGLVSTTNIDLRVSTYESL